MDERTVFLVSDGTGITAEVLSHSLLTQFPEIRFETVAIPYVNTVERAADAAARIDAEAERSGREPLVFMTFADDAIHDAVVGARGVFFDLFDAFIGPLERVLERPSSHTAGQTHGLTDPESYRSRISAIDFTMHCDDGINTVDYTDADVVMLGVSRSGKTPTCLYAALHYGLRAANYPLLENDLDRGRLPADLEPARQKLFGLTIEPGRLRELRKERRPGSRYAKLAQCRLEVAAAEALYRRERIPFLDVTSMSIEEIATTMMNRRGLHRHFY